ncbi:precorrin-6y C5,15-methyltransferase (decarboxylating) subunit CbiE [Methylobacterium sp. 77]|uniref:precorrin-6y C5,15-methyltransferase (decarboxylating) subunit CbiE n=1 Tax=Methylobacterium sp. 77 TaxID=1101192 RepID=UPI000366FAAC|nr:precorrin-6y C5,15-methyltransferase (decarboxylating) subunit CbiE [Methylobacterium sp. 77]
MSDDALSSLSPWLTIVGIGEDGRAGLSPAAIAALDEAGMVYGGSRHIALAAPVNADVRVWPRPISDAYPGLLARRGQPTCILATGDPFHYGIGAEIARLLPAAEMRVFPHPSAFSLAAARLGWPLAETVCLTLHGRALERIVPHLQPGARLLVLTWDGTTPEAVATLLTDRGFGGSLLTILEAMGGPRERRHEAKADAFALTDIDPLNTLAVDVVADADARVMALSAGLDDSWFEHDGQLTKADIRAVTLAALRPRAGQLLWDIGAGAGSISIEWMLRHPSLRSLAIEANPSRALRIARNAARLGVPDLRVVEGEAPAAMRGLDRPDAIFIGGGITRPGVLDLAIDALATGGRLVANVVTLEGEAVLLAAFARHGGRLKRLSIAHADPVGHLHGWRTAMPVTQWVWTKP